MKKIAIVGAGIGGLAAALAIPDEHYQLDIFEKASEIRGVGSGLTLWPNATCVLQALGVLDECLALGGRLDQLQIQMADGRPKMIIPTGVFPTPAVAMHRADLHRVLMSRLKAPQIHVGRTCIGVRHAPEGTYVCFQDGESGPYELVVAADGLRSRLRAHVCGEVELRPKGYSIWRGLTEAADLFPDNGSFFEIWGHSLRFGVLPLGQGRICWYAARNQPAGDRRAAAEQKTSLLRDFKSWRFPAREIVERTALDTFIPSDAVDLKPIRGWYRDRVLLLGDAIHPMPANLGLGGNMALEDGIVLGNLLRRTQDIPLVCREFERLRFARVNAVTSDSNFVGFFCQTTNPLVTKFRNFACSLIPGRYFTWEAKPLYAYRADLISY